MILDESSATFETPEDIRWGSESPGLETPRSDRFPGFPVADTGNSKLFYHSFYFTV
jgi:hypothetical protein